MVDTVARVVEKFLDQYKPVVIAFVLSVATFILLAFYLLKIDLFYVDSFLSGNKIVLFAAFVIFLLSTLFLFSEAFSACWHTATRRRLQKDKLQNS